MVRQQWPEDGPGAGADPAAQANTGTGRGGGSDSATPSHAGDRQRPVIQGSGGTWQEVFHSGTAIATDGGIAVSGIHNSTVQLPPEALRPPAEVDAPAGLDNLPHRPGLFVGRGCELDRLDAALAAPGTALVQAVYGLGGIGKSTLAAHWAATRPHGQAPIRWITADSPAAVRQGLADIASALQPALTQALPVEALAEWATQWLASHTGWLVVLDNVNDPADIAPLIARARGGRFLITSRLTTAWSDATTLVRLDNLEPDESLALLTRIATAPHPERDLDGAADLCEELGHLPLAIEQAAAFLAQNPLTTARAYLHLLAQHPAAMYRLGAATTPVERTIARVWNVTLDRITHLQPAAADLLRTLAWYASENIPTALAWGMGLSAPGAQEAALGLLTAYSLITPDPDTDTLSVHRLVQALARTPDPTDPHRTPALVDRAREQATDVLYANLPDTFHSRVTWSTWRELLPHVDALADHTEGDPDITTVFLLDRIGGFLADQGMPARAIGHFQRSLAGTVRLRGKDHPETLAARNNLAYAYSAAGDLDRAVPLHERTLRDLVRVLGENHPSTLASRHNLATAYASAGDLDRAIPLHEQTLRTQVWVLGDDHPSTPLSRHNLATACESAGDLGRATRLHEHTLEDRVRVLGKDHPDTLTSRSHLAAVHESAGDLDRAIPLYEQTLTATERVLGEDHPDTLTSRNNLAVAYASAGDLDRAIPLYEQTLTTAVRVLGEDHPDTLTSRNNLAIGYALAGDLGRAIPLYQQTLTAAVRVLGEEHPFTVKVRADLDAVITEHDGGIRPS